MDYDTIFRYDEPVKPNKETKKSHSFTPFTHIGKDATKLILEELYEKDLKTIRLVNKELDEIASTILQERKNDEFWKEKERIEKERIENEEINRKKKESKRKEKLKKEKMMKARAELRRRAPEMYKLLDEIDREFDIKERYESETNEIGDIRH